MNDEKTVKNRLFEITFRCALSDISALPFPEKRASVLLEKKSQY
jgi:hypothetical protein